MIIIKFQKQKYANWVIPIINAQIINLNSLQYHVIVHLENTQITIFAKSVLYIVLSVINQHFALSIFNKIQKEKMVNLIL